MQEIRIIKADTLEGQLREMFGRAAYTHKTHEKMADALQARYEKIKYWEIGLSVLTTSSLIYSVFGNTLCATIIGACSSALLMGIILYTKGEDSRKLAFRHTDTASKLWAFRERILSLIVDLHDGVEEHDVRRRRDSIIDALEIIYKSAPRTNTIAYAAAQKAIKDSEELTFSSDELDRMLPPALRMSQNSN
jgi:hypothetical protein